MVEFALLERLSGYTRETLAEEPAYIIQHWLIIMDEEARAKNRQANAAR